VTSGIEDGVGNLAAANSGIVANFTWLHCV